MTELTSFTRRVVALIRSIPPGFVSTYGDIAAAAESPRSARQVARILHSMSEKHQLPWHRVVNKEGRIALTDSASIERQRQLLLEEGVAVSESGLIESFEQSRWLPVV